MFSVPDDPADGVLAFIRPSIQLQEAFNALSVGAMSCLEAIIEGQGPSFHAEPYSNFSFVQLPKMVHQETIWAFSGVSRGHPQEVTWKMASYWLCTLSTHIDSLAAGIDASPTLWQWHRNYRPQDKSGLGTKCGLTWSEAY